MDADRNLLFAILALQADVLTPTQFIEGCTLWANEKSVSIADVLVRCGWIGAEDMAHVDFLVERKLSRHGGDLRATLGDVTSDDVRRSLASLTDPHVQQTMAGLPTRSVGPESARSQSGPELLSTMAYQQESRDRYTLTHLHAKGGIGQVWLARDADLGREVALKELKPERADNPAHWARFLEEARITGQLEHPGIVPIYELGKRSADRHPFYTMRFIRGRTLQAASLAYHKNRVAGQGSSFELRELLGAFVAVCNAVAYAHSRGVLHRDLKGPNIVLGDFGEVMVLDWGLAKVIGDKGTEQSPSESAATDTAATDPSREQTMHGQVLGTPGYMAPEQAAGRLEQIDARTDVYGLGAILYHILTGTTTVAGTSSADVLLQTIEKAPTPPRECVADTPPALEAVCQKALAKRPKDRYQTVLELAQDVQHFLADEPVSAYRDPLAMRVFRWMRRHRTGMVAGVAAIAVALVSLAVATGLLVAAYREADLQRAEAQRQRDHASRERDRARQHFQAARAAVDQYHTQISDSPELKAIGLELMRQKLLESAVAFYQKFAREEGNDPSVRFEQSRAFMRFADLSRELGRPEQALAAYSDAVALLQELSAAERGRPEYQRDLALSQWKLGMFFHDNGRLGQAEAPYREALTLIQKLIDAHPDDLDFQRDRAGYQHSFARLLRDGGKLEEAEPIYMKALAFRERLVIDQPGNVEYEDDLAWTLFNTANLYNRLNRMELSERDYVRTWKLWQKVADVHPESPTYLNQVGMTLNNLANVYGKRGRADKSEEIQLEALKVRERLLEAHPRIADFQNNMAITLHNLGESYLETGRVAKADAVTRQAVKIRKQLTASQPDSVDYLVELASDNGLWGVILQDQGKLADAIALHESAIGHLRKALKKEPNHAGAKEELVGAELRLGVVLSMAGKQVAAERALASASKEPEGADSLPSRVATVLVEARGTDQTGAVRKADALVKESLSGRDFYELARVYALCKQEPRAIEVLGRAKQMHYFDHGESIQRLRGDGTFAALRDRDDYRIFLKTLEKQ